MNTSDDRETTHANVDLSTRNSLYITVGLALLPVLAGKQTRRLKLPIRSISLRDSKVIIETGDGSRDTNMHLKVEFSNVVITSSTRTCCFTVEVVSELHHGASNTFQGSYAHGENGPRVELNIPVAA